MKVSSAVTAGATAGAWAVELHLFGSFLILTVSYGGVKNV